MELKEVKVEIKKLPPEFLQWRLDKKLCEESHTIFKKLMKYHISTVIALQHPEIYKDFPDELPQELQYTAKQPVKSKVTKESKLQTLQDETRKLRPVSAKRSTRYSGAYNVAEIEKQQNAANLAANNNKELLKHKKRTTSSSSAGSSVNLQKSSIQQLKMTIKKTGLNSVIVTKPESSSSSESESDSSSDSENEQMAQSNREHLMQTPGNSKVKSAVNTLSGSSSSEDEAVKTTVVKPIVRRPALTRPVEALDPSFSVNKPVKRQAVNSTNIKKPVQTTTQLLKAAISTSAMLTKMHTVRIRFRRLNYLITLNYYSRLQMSARRLQRLQTQTVMVNRFSSKPR